MPKTLFQQTFSGLNWTLFGTFLTSIFNLLVLVVLSRLLTPNDFGIVGAALIVINLSLIFTEIGVGPALIHYQNITKEHIDSSVIFSIGMGLITTIIIYLLSPTISRYFGIPELNSVLKVLSFLFLLKSLTAISESLLIKRLEFKTITLIRLFSYGVGYTFFGILFAFLGFSYWGLIIGTAINFLLETLLFTYFSRIKFDFKFSIFHIKELLGYGSSFSINKIFANIALQGDNFVIAKTLGSTSLGLYTRAYQIFTFPINLFGQAISKVLFSSFSIIQNDRPKISVIYQTLVFSVAMISGPITCFLYFFAEEIVSVILGNQWLELVPALQILALSFYFRLAYKLVDPLINAFGNLNRKAVYQFIYASLILGLGYLGSNYGLKGVAAGVGFSIFIYYLLVTSMVLNYLELSLLSFLYLHITPILIAAFNFLLFFYIKSLNLFDNNILKLAINIIALIVLNSLLLYLFRKIILEKIDWMLRKLPYIYKNELDE